MGQQTGPPSNSGRQSANDEPDSVDISAEENAFG
jgi:hypothetical protein